MKYRYKDSDIQCRENYLSNIYVRDNARTLTILKRICGRCLYATLDLYLADKKSDNRLLHYASSSTIELTSNNKTFPIFW